MKKLKSAAAAVSVATAMVLVLAGCGNADAQSQNTTEQQLKVVTSFTIIADMVHEIGGDRVEVHNLVPTGTDPHEYEPLPEDLKAAADADLLFYNGLNLEGGDAGWFKRMVDSVGQPEEHIFEVSAEVTPMYLGEGTRHEEINPHGFTDPNNGELMVQAIADALQIVDQANAKLYAERAAEYTEQLNSLEQEYAEKLGAIAPEKRILVTSERAFQYLADRYDLHEGYLWEIDTEENGSVQQITSLVEFLKANKVAYLVVESNVDPRPMQTVSEESGVPIFERAIFSDEIGDAANTDAANAGADTYLKYLEHNLGVLVGALGG